jgi:hypothetical protein
MQSAGLQEKVEAVNENGKSCNIKSHPHIDYSCSSSLSLTQKVKDKMTNGQAAHLGLTFEI